MTYALRFHPKAAKELESLDTAVQPRILTALTALQIDPFVSGSIQLKGGLGRRIRVGNYRVIYDVDRAESMITVFHVAHRKEAYR